VITLGKVCDRPRERASDTRLGAKLKLSDSLVVSVGGAFRVGAQGTCGVPGRLGVEQKVLSRWRCVLVITPRQIHGRGHKKPSGPLRRLTLPCLDASRQRCAHPCTLVFL